MNEEQLNEFRENLKDGDIVLFRRGYDIYGNKSDELTEWYFMGYQNLDDNSRLFKNNLEFCYISKVGSGIHTVSLSQIYPSDYLLKLKLTKKGKELGDLYDNL
jgi:hypothetical protein